MSKRNKRKRNRKKSLQDRVNDYDTWFDRTRASMTEVRESLRDYNDNLSDYAFRDMIQECHRQANRHGWRWGQPFPSENPLLFAESSQVKLWNSRLPFPLDLNRDVVSSVSEVLRNNKQHIHDWKSAVEGEVTSLTFLDDKGPTLVQYQDSLGTVVGTYTLSDPGSKLMVMEGDLAEQVLSSTNTEIGLEDLTKVPYRKMVLEFSSPVRILKELSVDGGGLEILGVGFYVLPRHDCYSITWFLNSDMFPIDGGIRVKSMVTVLYLGGLRRVVADDGMREALGRTASDFNVRREGVAVHGRDEDLRAYADSITEVHEEFCRLSRNIWDFLTCRNIDYVEQTRSGRGLPAGKKYQHIQDRTACPRKYQVLKVNKRITESKGNGGSWVPPFESKEVPGKFHKWIYCDSCGRVHRHDLIGRACRRCQKPVGPISNIEIKKHWHPPYLYGAGELVDSVHEVRR